MATNSLVARDIQDFKIARILLDCPPSDPVNPNAFTHDTLIDIPGISSFDMAFEFDTDELRGDGRIKDIFARVEKVTGSYGGCISRVAFQAMMGGRNFTYTDTIPLATGRSVWRLYDDFAPYISMESQTRFHNSAGDMHIKIWKARITNLSISQSTQQYVVFTADYEAIPTQFVFTDGNDPTNTGNLFFDLAENTTAVEVVAFVPTAD